MAFSAVQTATCADGQIISSYAHIPALDPIPLPQTLDYTDWQVEIFSSIPGWSEAFVSLYPNLSHCTFNDWDGQPVPKVVVDQLTSEVTNVVAVTPDTPSKPATSTVVAEPAVTTKTPSQTAATAYPPQSTQTKSTSLDVPQPLESGNNPSDGVGSVILCGLGGPCPTSPNPPSDQSQDGNNEAPELEDSSKDQPSPGSVYAGISATFYIAHPTETVPAEPAASASNAIPLYTIANGAVAVGTQTTLSAGGPVATISDVVISVDTDGVHLDNTVFSFAPAAIFTVGSDTYTYSAGVDALVVGSSTLAAGGPAVTISGHVISLGTVGVAVDGQTVAPGNVNAALAVFTVGSATYTATQGASSVVIGSQTLIAGGLAVVIAGETLGWGSSGVVVDGSTVPFSAGGTATVAIVTVGSSLYTFTEGEKTFVIGSKTLTAGGPAVTISGEVISLGPSGLVVGGSSTVPFSNTAVLTTAGANTLSGTETGAPAEYTGSASSVRLRDSYLALAMLLITAALLA